MADFLSMGGYAAFVWTAFGVTLIVLIGNVLMARRRMRRIWQELAARAAADQQRRGRG